MKLLSLMPIVELHCKTAAECDNKFFRFPVSMSPAILPSWDIIYPECTLYFEGNMVFFFNKGKITSLV